MNLKYFKPIARKNVNMYNETENKKTSGTNLHLFKYSKFPPNARHYNENKFRKLIIFCFYSSNIFSGVV